MPFGGPYSELNKRMRDFRDETRQRREKRNQYRESAGISSASSGNSSGKLKFTERDRQAFLKELKAEQYSNRVKNVLAVVIAVAIGVAIIWVLFF